MRCMIAALAVLVATVTRGDCSVTLCAICDSDGSHAPNVRVGDSAGCHEGETMLSCIAGSYYCPLSSTGGRTRASGNTLLSAGGQTPASGNTLPSTGGQIPASDNTSPIRATPARTSYEQEPEPGPKETFNRRCESVGERHAVVPGNQYEVVRHDVPDVPAVTCVDLQARVSLANPVIALVAVGADHDLAVWDWDPDWRGVEKYGRPHTLWRHRVGEWHDGEKGPHCIASGGRLERDADSRLYRPKGSGPYAVDQVRLTDGVHGLMACAAAYRPAERSPHTLHLVDESAAK